MSSPSAERLISRINALHKSLQLDEGAKPSAMERDLMLGYLRELYELYAHGIDRSVAPSRAASAPATPPAPAPAPILSAPSTAAPVAPRPVIPLTPAPEASVPRPVPAPAPAPPPPAPAPAPRPAPAPASSNLKELFAEDGIASPFGRQSVRDLTKALTINNRVLFSRDLFGGDNELLNTSLRTLNDSGAMAAARPVLESLARRFEWPEEAKKETAREFIELVRRRYA